MAAIRKLSDKEPYLKNVAMHTTVRH